MTIQNLVRVVIPSLFLAAPLCAAETGESGGQQDIVNYLIAFAVVLIFAKIGGELFERIGQPAVLGELLTGLVMGNAYLFGFGWFKGLEASTTLEITAEVGVILLLFEVGMETHLKELLAVGISALAVATVGVIAPMVLGYYTSIYFLPDAAWYVHLFAGATLAATSVGITARVLKDLGKTDTKEARIILGAAVVDDVLGLIVLAVVSGIVASVEHSGKATVEFLPVLFIIGKAVAFLACAIFIGQFVHIRAARLGKRFRVGGMAIVIPIVFCFLMSALAGLIGLAPIVGAFAAGLVLEPSEYDWEKDRKGISVEQLVSPLSSIFVPVFFVLMGYKVDLRSFLSPEVLGFAGALTLVAIIGKQVCSLGVLEKGVHRLIVGVGMIPRGEVGLIFTGIGAASFVAGKPVFDSQTVSAMVVMVMLTTVVTPPLLKVMFQRETQSRAVRAS